MSSKEGIDDICEEGFLLGEILETVELDLLEETSFFCKLETFEDVSSFCVLEVWEEVPISLSVEIEGVKSEKVKAELASLALFLLHPEKSADKIRMQAQR